ncbi:hypothetical protein QL285_005284 [Trifolium repens]|nr:hypothetical protein QL285_005284 [Trifolium repens]
MENLEFQPNTHLAAVYYKGGEANLFRIHINITIGDLKHQLTQLNSRCHYRDQRRVTDVEYRRLSVCSDGFVLFTNMRLTNDDDVRTMFNIFSQYMTKGPVELDTKLVRSVEDIGNLAAHVAN